MQTPSLPTMHLASCLWWKEVCIHSLSLSFLQSKSTHSRPSFHFHSAYDFKRQAKESQEEKGRPDTRHARARQDVHTPGLSCHHHYHMRTNPLHYFHIVKLSTKTLLSVQKKLQQACFRVCVETLDVGREREFLSESVPLQENVYGNTQETRTKQQTSIRPRKGNKPLRTEVYIHSHSDEKASSAFLPLLRSFPFPSSSPSYFEQKKGKRER